MDRNLHALITRDVLTDIVRIDVRGSVTEESRPSLVSLVARIRRMGITSPILVDLSRAGLVASTALAGLRNVLNAADEPSTARKAGAGVSLVLTATADGTSPAAGLYGQPLLLTDERTAELTGAQGNPPGVTVLCRGFGEYTDAELFAASDMLFSLLDNPETSRGSDLLARYNDVGGEISRRDLLRGLKEPASEGLEPAGAAPHGSAGGSRIAS